VAVVFRHEHDNVCRLEISGLLSERELTTAQECAADEIRRRGRIRLLVVLSQFDGWERSASWKDFGFYVRHGEDIERIAIVGDTRWRSEALTFAGADLRRAPVAFFRAAQAEAAEAWLARQS
jgi:hypothetical protein